MNPAVSPELTYTAYAAALTGIAWVPYILNRIAEMGLWPALRNPQPDGAPEAAWAWRSICAHRNAVENLVVFAALAVVVHLSGAANETTAVAAAVYFWSRVAHLLVYSFGIPVLRTVIFVVGFAAQATLFVAFLGVA